jgi:hypothetical protein
LEIEAVFHWLYEFGLDVLLGIEVKMKRQEHKPLTFSLKQPELFV